jgi:hypothetical protein
LIRAHVKRYLIAALFLISAGGLWIHYNYHSPSASMARFHSTDPSLFAYGYVPLVAGVSSVFLVPILFMFKRTMHLAHLLNGFAAIIGFITMGHFSIASAPPLYPDLGIIVAKFYMGRAIFELSLYSDLNAVPAASGWQKIRYPNIGYWYVHFVLLSVVYVLGHVLWR